MNLSAKTVTGSSGKTYRLDQRKDSGGEGDVYTLQSDTTLVAKIYNDQKLNETAPDGSNMRDYMEHKIKLMIGRFSNLNRSYRGSHFPILAWPKDALFYNGSFVGYLMPKIDVKYKIYDGYRTGIKEILFKNYSWKTSIGLACNMAHAVAFIHSCDLIIGDFNPNNFVINEKDGSLTFIDTDSFDITDKTNGKQYKCTVGFPENLAPELQKHDLSRPRAQFTRETDCFSLAVYIFNILMNNYNPFGFINTLPRGPSVSRNRVITSIAEGKCVYVRDIPGLKPQKDAPDFNMLPQYIRNLFVRTFNYTAGTVNQTIHCRPSAQEWYEALLKLYNSGDFKTCQHGHVYYKPYGHCPWCETGATRSSTPKQHYAAETETGNGAAVFASSTSSQSGAGPLYAAMIAAGIVLSYLLATLLPEYTGYDLFWFMLSDWNLSAEWTMYILMGLGAMIGLTIAGLNYADYQASSSPGQYYWKILLIPVFLILSLYALWFIIGVGIFIINCFITLLLIGVVVICLAGN